jgi:pantetheine-phosphate adenylyltransferase
VRDSSSRPVRPAALTAVYTGTFDPITLGHLDVIQRAAALFPKLVIGVGSNPEKSSLFTAEERVALVEACTADLAGVSVRAFQGLTVRFVRDCGAGVIVRGVRSVADMDYELTMARTNRAIEPSAETLFLPAGESVAHISATLVRQIAREATRDELERFVPEVVIKALLAKRRQSK